MEENFNADKMELNNIDIYLNALNKCGYTENVVTFGFGLVQKMSHSFIVFNIRQY